MSWSKLTREGGERRTHDLDDTVDELDALLNFLLAVAGDQTVQLIVLVVLESSSRPPLALLDTALAANADLGSALPLHLLERVTTRADEETEEVDLGELLDGDIDLVLRATAILALGHEVLGRRAEVGIGLHLAVDETHALVFKALAVPDFARVRSSSVGVVGRGRGGRARAIGRDDEAGAKSAGDLVEAELD